jgi:hypothetical protein
VARLAWHVDDKVRVRAEVRPRRYSSREGTVVEVRRVSPRGHSPTQHEVGVRVGTGVVWFLPAELERA